MADTRKMRSEEKTHSSADKLVEMTLTIFGAEQSPGVNNSAVGVKSLIVQLTGECTRGKNVLKCRMQNEDQRTHVSPASVKGGWQHIPASSRCPVHALAVV